MFKKINKELGQASRLLLVLAVVVLVAVLITFLIMKMAEKPPKPTTPTTSVPLPVYEKQLGDINFIFESAIDKGNVLKVSDIKDNQYGYSSQNNLTTGERFIQVTVGAQNKGTENTEQNAWDIENIVDSKGRNFVPDDQSTVGPWLPNPDLCGALLKPAFQPTPCTKIYEVSKVSTGLKITVVIKKDNGKKDSFLLDLIVK